MYDLDTYQQIEKIKRLQWIRQSAIALESSLKSEDTQEIEQAKQAYQDLIDSFYAEMSDLVPLQQMNAARRNPEYFLRLIVLALSYYADKLDAGEQIQ